MEDSPRTPQTAESMRRGRSELPTSALRAPQLPAGPTKYHELYAAKQAEWKRTKPTTGMIIAATEELIGAYCALHSIAKVHGDEFLERLCIVPEARKAAAAGGGSGDLRRETKPELVAELLWCSAKQLHAKPFGQLWIRQVETITKNLRIDREIYTKPSKRKELSEDDELDLKQAISMIISLPPLTSCLLPEVVPFYFLPLSYFLPPLLPAHPPPHVMYSATKTTAASARR